MARSDYSGRCVIMVTLVFAIYFISDDISKKVVYNNAIEDKDLENICPLISRSKCETICEGACIWEYGINKCNLGSKKQTVLVSVSNWYYGISSQEFKCEKENYNGEHGIIFICSLLLAGLVIRPVLTLYKSICNFLNPTFEVIVQ